MPIKLVNSNKKKAYEVNYTATKNIIDEVKKNKSSFAASSHKQQEEIFDILWYQFINY